MNLRHLAKALYLLAVVGIMSVAIARADEREAQTSRPPLSFERRGALETAAANLALPPWQREIMLEITRDTSPNAIGASSRHAAGLSPRRLVAASEDGEWAGILPPGRYFHSAIYDPERDRMVVFGGHDGSSYSNAVWALTLSGSPAWSEIVPTGTLPSRREGHTAIYDPVRDRMVVFGGIDGTVRDDVWALTLSGIPAWSELVTSGSLPPRRYEHAAIYDPVRDQMVVSGGSDGSYYNDVWTLSLSGNPRWSTLAPVGSPPPSLFDHAAIYDPVRDRMLVFAGNVWALSLSGEPAWSALSPSGSGPPGGETTAIYDPQRDRMVVFGGDPGSLRDEVWALTLSGSPAWSALTPSGNRPTGRYQHTAIYDPVREQMVVFGGDDDSGYRSDAWALTVSENPAWSLLATGTMPTARQRHTAIYDPVRDRMVVFGGLDPHLIRNDVWVLTLSGSPSWSALAPSGSPPPGRQGHMAIYDPVRDQMVVFGGYDYDSNNPRNDVWVLTLSGNPAWSELIPSGSPPPPRFAPSAIYDPVRDRMVMFGGYNGNGLRNDVWALTLSGNAAWIELSPSGSAPSGRLEHTAIYDPVRDRMVVFGGGGYRNDVWVLTLAGSPAWSELAPAGGLPSGRYGHTAIYDPLRDRMVVFGGFDSGFSPRNDAWILKLSGTPAWQLLAPSGTPPTSRYLHSAIFDPVQDRMVVFGGGRNDVVALSWDFQINDVVALPPPSRIFLHAVRPNPARSVAEVRYEIARDAHVSLEVLDIQGRITRRLRHGIQTAGSHSVVFDRRDDAGRLLPAGMYLIRLTTRNEARTTRIVILH